MLFPVTGWSRTGERPEYPGKVVAVNESGVGGDALDRTLGKGKLEFGSFDPFIPVISLR